MKEAKPMFGRDVLPRVELAITRDGKVSLWCEVVRPFCHNCPWESYCRGLLHAIRDYLERAV
jgi:hypothetical protein